MIKVIFLFKNLTGVMRLAILVNFPRLYPLIPAKKLVASCKITENCNSKCLGCNFHKNTSKDMNYDQWISVFDQLKDNDIKLVRFSGGEPMLRDDILDLLEYVKKIGLYVSIQSNILLLDEYKVKKMAEIGVNKIAVSIDGIGKDYKTYRGIDAFEKVERTLYMVRKHFMDKVDITPTITDASLDTLDDVITFAKLIKIPVDNFNMVNFTHYFYVDEDEYNKKSYNNIDRKKLKNLLINIYNRRSEYLKIKKYGLYSIYRYFEDFQLKDLPCLNPVYKICIGSGGNIYGCCSQDPSGNVLETPLREILKSKAFHKVTLSALNKTCPGCNCGLTLNSRLSLKYRIMPYFSKFLTNHSG